MRATKQKRESVQHDFSLTKPNGNKKVRSTDYPIVQFFNDNIVENIVQSHCIGTDQHMCMNWISCKVCKNTFPSEDESYEKCKVQFSDQIGESGLFTKTLIKKDEYICRYQGQKVAKGTVGKYVVRIDKTLTLDASDTCNLAKFANHSCKPNCVLQKVSRDVCLTGTSKHPFSSNEFQTELFIKATVDISEDTEITYDYGKMYNFDKDGCLYTEYTTHKNQPGDE